jgi:CIC family chloride channel protein
MAEPTEPQSDEPESGERNRAFAVASAAMIRSVRGVAGIVGWMRPSEPLELQIVGRTLLHAAAVGLGAGILGVLFFAGAELTQSIMLEKLAGYEPLRAAGERVWGGFELPPLRLWLLAFIPALGALVAGFITRYATECRGGGGDATIDAFHHHNGVLRRRVLWVKPLASIATLGSGGSGGREGPTMQLGAALGSTVGRYLKVSERERRVLMVAGIAAGISAVFRTPLGAALLAIEMLYRDDFEAEALIPAVLASVIAYSVSITVFGESTMFGHLIPYTFRPQHIPLFILLAIIVSLAASLFVGSLRAAHRFAKKLPVAEWLRPAVGGLALGIFVVLSIHFLAPFIGRGDRGVGILGGGYGIAQAAITGADWLPPGWQAVEVLVLLAIAKILATSLTIGSGGSAGDFAPALAIGATLGGAFGLAAQLILDDPTIQPGAFALVGMGAFYGGIANTPLAAVVLICEMAGSYELLVPLMLALGVAFVALRRVQLYPAQLRSVRESPVHRQELDPLHRIRCRDVVRLDRKFEIVSPETSLAELTRLAEATPDQDVYPVMDAKGALRGVISVEALRIVANNPELRSVAVAADLMTPPVSVGLDQDLRSAAAVMIARDLRSVPVVDESGNILTMLDEHDISAAVVEPPMRRALTLDH